MLALTQLNMHTKATGFFIGQTEPERGVLPLFCQSLWLCIMLGQPERPFRVFVFLHHKNNIIKIKTHHG